MEDQRQADMRRFVAARSAALVRTAYLLTGDWGYAEDLVQTALAKTFLAWGRFREGNVEAYCRRVLINTYGSWWRRRWRSEQPQAELPEQSTGESTAACEDRQVLLAALSRLPRRMRAVVVLRYVEDRSEAEVADLLGCSVGTVKSQASRGLAKLRADTDVADLHGRCPS